MGALDPSAEIWLCFPTSLQRGPRSNTLGAMPGHLQSLLLVRVRPTLREIGPDPPLSSSVWQRPVAISSVFPLPRGLRAIEQYFFKSFHYEPLQVEKRELVFARMVMEVVYSILLQARCSYKVLCVFTTVRTILFHTVSVLAWVHRKAVPTPTSSRVNSV